ncbi:pterin dehydratase [Glycomyces albidus]|jgi:hypothetical protein|uniref:Pterin dehydratase n=1 Tax=Glycomyces albidus TaxID=2656774 RepID=A0A6L5GB65_9ACTN|nr:pterin dehydratase [Glycomyces albidus]MQM26919.1 pterin dehydratase [Glycomyces albidus]
MGRTEQDDNVLLDALRELNGWVADDGRLSRSLPLDDSQHAELAEQIKIFADTLGVHADVRRIGDATLIVLAREEGGFSLTDVTFAGRVETAYITIAGDLAAEETHLSRGRFRWLRRGD